MNSRCIQKLHERSEHGVGVGLGRVGVGLALHLAQDLSHLTHAPVEAGQEAGTIEQGTDIEQILQNRDNITGIIEQI